jgi:fatty-acyl-CoA synthase
VREVALREYADELRLLAKVLGRAARYLPGGRRTVPDLLEARARELGGRPAIVFGDERFSFAEWNARANRFAHWGAREGLRRGDVVALLMENRPEFLFAWSGLAKLGVVTALLNTNLSGRALEHAVEAVRPCRLVVGAECVDRVVSAPGVGRALVVADREPRELPGGAVSIDAALASVPENDPGLGARSGVRTGDDLLLIYTSGTTGAPKAARFSNLRFLAIADVLAMITGATSRDVLYDVLPLYHTAGGVMLPGLALFAGATLVLRRKFSASHFWEDVWRHGVTGFQYIGELCRYLLAQPAHHLDRSHRLRFALGNGLRPDVWPEFRDRYGIPRIYEFYGATEGNVILLNRDNAVGSVGRVLLKPLSNARIVRYDVENDTHPRDREGFFVECAPGEVGEMIGRLPRSSQIAVGRFEGYTSGADTERKTLREVFRRGDAWFRTGDLLRRDARGYYYFVDRIGDTYRWKGENVSTQEVAELLGAFPGVQVVNVYGVRVPGHDGRAGMAAVVLRAGASFDGAAFHAFVAGRLPRYAAPAFVRLQGEADLTGTFKLRKFDLQKQGFDPRAVADPLFVRDDAALAYVPLTRELHDAVCASRFAL